MDKDDLWRTLRCVGKAQDKAALDTIMLRYRPIAPKPTTGQPCVGDNSNSYGTGKRTKRKYVRVSKNNKNNNNCRRKGRSGASDPVNDPYVAGDIVTLQLLPEKSDLNDEPTPSVLENLDPMVETIVGEQTHVTGTWIVVDGGDPVDPAAETRRGTEVETWVTVESVTGACGGYSSHALGCTDVEIVDSLDKDTCPGFISDGSNRVMWVSEAYRRTVSGDIGIGESPEVVVWLVTDGTTPFPESRSFTCRVRLQYTWQETKYTKTVPCDVWRMEFGGFAWRLDTRTALTLWL